MIEYQRFARSADMAQLVEQLIRNQQVAGSNPAISSRKERRILCVLFYFSVIFAAETVCHSPTDEERKRQEDRVHRKILLRRFRPLT